MLYFYTKKSNLGKFGRILQRKILVHVMAIWSMYLHYSGLFYGPLVYFVVIWYSFPLFGMPYQEKSGNPEAYLAHLDEKNVKKLFSRLGRT
jgi:hypothetical protein